MWLKTRFKIDKIFYLFLIPRTVFVFSKKLNYFNKQFFFITLQLVIKETSIQSKLLIYAIYEVTHELLRSHNNVYKSHLSISG